MSVKRVTMHEVTCDACVAEERGRAAAPAPPYAVTIKPFATLAEHPRFRVTLGHKSVDLCPGHTEMARDEPEQLLALLDPPPEPEPAVEPTPDPVVRTQITEDEWVDLRTVSDPEGEQVLLAIGEFEVTSLPRWRLARATVADRFAKKVEVDETELRRVLSACGLLSMFYGDGTGPFFDGVSYWMGPSGKQHLPLMSFPACPIEQDHRDAVIAAYEAGQATALNSSVAGVLVWLAKAVAYALDECEYPTFAVTR